MVLLYTFRVEGRISKNVQKFEHMKSVSARITGVKSDSQDWRLRNLTSVSLLYQLLRSVLVYKTHETGRPVVGFFGTELVIKKKTCQITLKPIKFSIKVRSRFVTPSAVLALSLSLSHFPIYTYPHACSRYGFLFSLFFFTPLFRIVYVPQKIKPPTSPEEYYTNPHWIHQRVFIKTKNLSPQKLPSWHPRLIFLD